MATPATAADELASANAATTTATIVGNFIDIAEFQWTNIAAELQT